MTEVSTGKCPDCGDQLLSIPGCTPGAERRTICPICVTNERDEMRSVLTGTAAGLKLWNMHKSLQYIPSPEEVERMAQ